MLSSNFLPFHRKIILTAIKPECKISVVIPVRNEAAHLPASLKAFTHQIDKDKQPLNPNLFEIIIFANNCRDQSVNIIRQWQIANPHLNIHFFERELASCEANIGYVRRTLMNEAYLRLIQNEDKSGLILTTDGDTEVAPDWINANSREIDAGADAVGGRILIKISELKRMEAKTRRFYLLDTGYRILAAEIEAVLDFVPHDYLPRHHQHFNGSFGVTTPAFERAGGIPEVSFLEDVAFFRSLERIDAKFRHSSKVRVYTSARSVGRTELGLSTQINEWAVMADNGDKYFVESCEALVRRLNMRRALRELWQAFQKDNISIQEISPWANRLSIDENLLQSELISSATFGIFYEKIREYPDVVAKEEKCFPLVNIERAIFDLRNLIAALNVRNCPAHTSS